MPSGQQSVHCMAGLYSEAGLIQHPVIHSRGGGFVGVLCAIPVCPQATVHIRLQNPHRYTGSVPRPAMWMENELIASVSLRGG
jgi:hypothetical protein